MKWVEGTPQQWRHSPSSTDLSAQGGYQVSINFYINVMVWSIGASAAPSRAGAVVEERER